MHEAKTHLSRYVAGLTRDESLILCNRNQPGAELRLLPRKAGKPRIGVSEGEFVVPEAFFEPLPGEILKVFGGRKSS